MLLNELRDFVRKVLNEITIKDAWDKFYFDKTKFPALNGNEELFIKLNDLYPKNNDNFDKGTFTWLYNLLSKGALKEEDFYKAKEYLEVFKKFINVIPVENRDINKYKSLPDLYVVVKPFIESNENIPISKNQEAKDIKQNESQKVYEDDEWLIVVPKTERAACFYGKGTQWCTASTKSDNKFNLYNEGGKLYILINKKFKEEKYQIHFETSEIMDAEDRKVCASYFFQNEAGRNVMNYFEKTRKDFDTFIAYADVDLAIQDAVDDDIYYDSVEKLEGESREYILDKLRDNVVDYGSGEGGEYSVYMGFMLEGDALRITDEQIENLVHHNETKNIIRVFEHMKEIGYDFGVSKENLDSGIVNYINAMEMLNKYKLELDTEYKTDKGNKITILKVSDDSSDGLKFRVKFNNEYKVAGIETINNLIHQRQLFNKKQAKGIREIREIIRKIIIESL